jgi:hypothetical protein
MFLHGQFLEGCVILSSLLIIWEFLVIIIKSIPFILAHFHVCWHVGVNYLLWQFSDLVTSLHHRHHMHLKIYQLLLGLHSRCLHLMNAKTSCCNINAFPINATNLLITNSLCVCFFARMMERQCNWCKCKTLRWFDSLIIVVSLRALVQSWKISDVNRTLNFHFW